MSLSNNFVLPQCSDVVTGFYRDDGRRRCNAGLATRVCHDKDSTLLTLLVLLSYNIANLASEKDMMGVCSYDQGLSTEVLILG